MLTSDLFDTISRPGQPAIEAQPGLDWQGLQCLVESVPVHSLEIRVGLELLPSDTVPSSGRNKSKRFGSNCKRVRARDRKSVV